MEEAQINLLAARDKKQVTGFVIAQLITSGVLAVLLLLYDVTAAYSGFVGGMIATLANGWFALKVFSAGSKHQNRQPVAALRGFYWAELNKLIMTGASFIAAFVLMKPVNAAALLAVYFLVHMMPAILGAISAGRNRDPYIKDNEES